MIDHSLAYPSRTPLGMRLDAVFELRGMPTEVLRQMAIKRGIRANKGRVHLMRAIYWDIVRQDEAGHALYGAAVIAELGL